MTKKTMNRREALHAARDPGEDLDKTPVEIPVGSHKPKSISQQIQEQIAIQIAKKKSGE